MENSTQKLIGLVDMNDPESVFHEVEIILHSIDPSFSIREISRVFEDIIRLFEGSYPGYQACNTEYHDLRHTMEVFLATARLIHGAFVDHQPLSEKMINIDIISALMHDTGYNQTLDDTSGTGAKYTVDHILRSIDFCKHYFAGHPRFNSESKSFSDILLCTGFTERINEIRFLNQEVETAGKILGSADLLGQMADRFYLEKLLFLYYEFKEAGIADYESEYDLLLKTMHFYDATLNRMKYDLGSVYKHMRSHFQVRWGIDRDLYMDSINNNIDYLRQVIRHEEYTSLLRRGGIVKKIQMRGLQA